MRVNDKRLSGVSSEVINYTTVHVRFEISADLLGLYEHRSKCSNTSFENLEEAPYMTEFGLEPFYPISKPELLMGDTNY